MKKQIEELKQKDVKELEKEEKDLKLEIVRLSLEFKVNRPKDLNIIFKKKKKLAQVLTVLREKQS